MQPRDTVLGDPYLSYMQIVLFSDLKHQLGIYTVYTMYIIILYDIIILKRESLC
jgi:hypothetical protein